MSLFNNDDYESFVARLFAPHPEPAVRFTHAVLGIVTEVYELDHATDETNAIEELGDLLFYVKAALIVLSEAFGEEARDAATQQAGETLDALPQPEDLRAVQRMRAEAINELLDDAKRWLAYGKSPDLVKVIVRMSVAATAASLNRWPDEGDEDELLDRAVSANRRKLQARYDGTFTKEAALNRNLEAERNALESAGAERA